MFVIASSSIVIIIIMIIMIIIMSPVLGWNRLGSLGGPGLPEAWLPLRAATGVCEKTLLLGEPLPCNLSAVTAIQPLIWCS